MGNEPSNGRARLAEPNRKRRHSVKEQLCQYPHIRLTVELIRYVDNGLEVAAAGFRLGKPRPTIIGSRPSQSKRLLSGLLTRPESAPDRRILTPADPGRFASGRQIGPPRAGWAHSPLG